MNAKRWKSYNFLHNQHKIIRELKKDGSREIFSGLLFVGDLANQSKS